MTKTMVFIVVCLAMGLAPSAHAAGTPEQKCASAKLKAAGKKLAGKMGCHSKAKIAGLATDPLCLTKAEAKFDAAVAKAGGACPGSAAPLESAVDSCVGNLLSDIPGSGRCPGTSAKVAGKAGSGLFGCRAKEITKPGSFVVCDAKVDGKLGTSLAKSGACVVTDDVHTSLHECVSSIGDIVDPPPTTTSTSSSTSTTTLPCGSTAYPTCGGGCPPGNSCIARSDDLDGESCVCRPGAPACAPGEAQLTAFHGSLPGGCANPPTCFEPSSTYPTCTGNAPPGQVCQAYRVLSLTNPSTGCLPIPASPSCDSTCPSNPQLGACPAGQVCMTTSDSGFGYDCGCTPPPTCYDTCGGSCPSGSACLSAGPFCVCAGD